ncbi:site-specific integrase [Acidipila sp. EB88]|uniref:site-specific integrase n=1 Tax=Acidipila sp. EB88 TaxID=2305226 RepID=UPI000F5F91B9|nr:site-specific integrase [Acidipila sp. EB88]RRA50440.1 integrase [Acidipila sp. EB88]
MDEVDLDRPSHLRSSPFALAGTKPSLPELAPDDPLWRTAEAANQYVRAAKSPATRRAYAADWRHFAAWCGEHGLQSLPAEPATVALYLAALGATHKPATITRRLTAISAVHGEADHPSPANLSHRLVADTLHGIRRTLGTSQKAKEPLSVTQLIRVLDHLEGGLLAARDRALLLVGFSGGLRRSEVATLSIDKLEWHKTGITIRLERSKTDQEGEGREVEIPLGQHPETCPVRALKSWLERANLTEGRVFRRVDRHGNVGMALDKDSIGVIVQRSVKRAGLAAKHYGGHSLRAGFATQAYLKGATELEIMQQTGHRSLAMVRRYIREGKKLRQTAAGKLGL